MIIPAIRAQNNEPKTNPIYRGVASGEAGTKPISEAKNDHGGGQQKDLENKG
jgi:hypothetical protein